MPLGSSTDHSYRNLALHRSKILEVSQVHVNGFQKSWNLPPLVSCLTLEAVLPSTARQHGVK